MFVCVYIYLYVYIYIYLYLRFLDFSSNSLCNLSIIYLYLLVYKIHVNWYVSDGNIVHFCGLFLCIVENEGLKSIDNGGNNGNPPFFWWGKWVCQWGAQITWSKCVCASWSWLSPWSWKYGWGCWWQWILLAMSIGIFREKLFSRFKLAKHYDRGQKTGQCSIANQWL